MKIQAQTEIITVYNMTMKQRSHVCVLLAHSLADSSN